MQRPRLLRLLLLLLLPMSVGGLPLAQASARPPAPSPLPPGMIAPPPRRLRWGEAVVDVLTEVFKKYLGDYLISNDKKRLAKEAAEEAKRCSEIDCWVEANENAEAKAIEKQQDALNKMKNGK